MSTTVNYILKAKKASLLIGMLTYKSKYHNVTYGLCNYAISDYKNFP